MESKTDRTRGIILDAAERLVLDVGVARLTLEAAAREAGLSKGGLLYHFPTKEALVRAMIARYGDRFDRAREGLALADPRPDGRHTRAYIKASLGEGAGAGADIDSLGAALIAAVANDPALLDPIRERYRAWQADLEEDGIDPVTATLLRLAIDGLWMTEVFGLARVPVALRRKLLARLMDMSAPAPVGAAEASPAS